MADIMRSDVRTYVRELVAKEFGNHTDTEKVLSDNPKTITGESRNGQQQPFYNQPLMGNRLKNGGNRDER